MFTALFKKTSYRLQRRLVLLTLTITLGVGILFSTVFTSLYQEYLIHSLMTSTATNMKFLADSINSNLESVNHLIRWAQTNTTISQYVEAPNNSSYGIHALKAHERLTEEYQNSPSNSMIHRVVIGNMHQRFIQIIPATHSSTHDLGIAIPALSYFDDLLHSPSKQLSTGFIDDPFYASLNKKIIPIIRPIYAQYNSTESGWIFLSITQDLFTSALQYYSFSDDAPLYLVLGNHTYQMHDDTITPSSFSYEIKEELEKPQNHFSQNDYHTYMVQEYPADKKSIIIIRPLLQSECYIIQTLSEQELQKQNQMLIVIWIVIFLLMLFVALLLTYILHRLIAIPVQKIRNQISSVSRGNFDTDTSIEWNHELGDIGRGINKLAGDLEQLIENRIADEKEKKDLEYKVLQNQINPHFLYNTLNSIKWMATVQGANGIADMTTSLSRLLRSISKGTQLLIPLAEELELVKDYFNIQNYRYGGTIQLEIICDDESLLQTSIIKFTLQPIVENAIFHGLEPKGNAGTIHILVHAAPEFPEDHVEIIIKDNGVGISSEKIAKILTDTQAAPSEFFKEIGVANVQKRLQYEFGPQYGIHIESQINEYTEMHIVIPANHKYEEKENV